MCAKDGTAFHGAIQLIFTQSDLSIIDSKKGVDYNFDNIGEIFFDSEILKIEMKNITTKDKLFGKNRVWIGADEIPNFLSFIEIFNNVSLVKQSRLFI